MRYPFPRLWWLASLLAFLASSPAARADERFTLNVVTRGPVGAGERVVRVYLQGDQARVEDGGSTVFIYDARGGRVYRLDTASKTFRVDAAAREQASMADRLAQPNQPKATIKLTAQQEIRTIDGLQAQRATVVAQVESDRSAPSSGGGFSHDGMRTPTQTARPAFGIPVAVGSGADADPSEDDRVVAIHLEGEYWLASDSPASRNPQALRRIFEESLPREKLAKRLLDTLMKVITAEAPRLPLSSQVTLRLTRASMSVDTVDADRPTIVVTTTVKDRVEGPLDRMLFIVPADYHAADS